jgi:hypothetical protein
VVRRITEINLTLQNTSTTNTPYAQWKIA